MINLLKKLSVSVILLFFFTDNGYSLPAMTAQPINSWHYSIAPYVWASSLNGDMQVKGRQAHINIPFSEILKHLDFAFQGHFEAGYGPWTLMLDPTYLNVSDEEHFKSIELKIISKTLLVDAGVFYRLLAKPIKENHYVSVELLGGARHLGIANTLNADFVPFSDKVTMNTPIIGARLRADLSPKTNFWLRGDVGGFHVDHVNKTWSTTAGLTYAYKKQIDWGIAYRVLKIDYAKNHSSMNVLMHGPAIGVSFHG